MILDRITYDPKIMGGKACIRGMRITVTVVLKLLAAGATREQILADYPYLDSEDITQALQYAVLLADDQYLMNIGP